MEFFTAFYIEYTVPSRNRKSKSPQHFRIRGLTALAENLLSLRQPVALVRVLMRMKPEPPHQ